jgi:hypothetical protein
MSLSRSYGRPDRTRGHRSALSGCSRQRCAATVLYQIRYILYSWYQNGTIRSYGINLNVSLTSQIYVSTVAQISGYLQKVYEFI